MVIACETVWKLPTQRLHRASFRSLSHNLEAHGKRVDSCMLGSMAGAFEQPLFFSSAMITTSSRLQHLDSHFSLHTRFSGCRRATTRPPVDRIQSSPSLLPSPPLKNSKRSTSRSSTSSDSASFHTAVSNAEKDDGREVKTACLPTNRQEAAIALEKAPVKERTRSEVDAQDKTSREPTPYLWSIPVTEPHKELPERSSTVSQRKRAHKGLNRRRTSTISEPLPSSSIPRRTSSTLHRRQRKGQDLISFHRDSCRLFQSLEGTLCSNLEETRPVFSRHCSMPGSRSASVDEPLDRPTVHKPTRRLEDHVEDQARSNQTGSTGGEETSDHTDSTISLPVSVDIEDTPRPMGPTAATVVSWTTAETREREYEKIDQAHSGFRGLWKKLTPKWCHGRNSRRKFFEGKCDGDSVRRYRMEVCDQNRQ